MGAVLLCASEGARFSDWPQITEQVGSTVEIRTQRHLCSSPRHSPIALSKRLEDREVVPGEVVPLASPKYTRGRFSRELELCSAQDPRRRRGMGLHITFAHPLLLGHPKAAAHVRGVGGLP